MDIGILKPLQRKLQKNLAGKQFGKLIVIIHVGVDKNKRLYYLCKCTCGEKVIIRRDSLIAGHTKSCGCLLIEQNKKRKPHKHGLCNSFEYSSWVHMKQRCYNLNNKFYYNYGGRGIAVCRRWRNSFENFYKDMGKKPSKEYSIDRIDNNLGYIPFNCNWSTQKEQCNNKRNSQKIYFNNEEHPLDEWSIILNIKKSTLYYRLNKSGWDVERAFTTKVKNKNKNYK